ncbi:MAG: hypothetical protein QG656_1358 [Candidatus Hydrogenedentes bacterium]|nr:hypothetical protein [Candidatus Hydrogenedentota bacterium]
MKQVVLLLMVGMLLLPACTNKSEVKEEVKQAEPPPPPRIPTPEEIYNEIRPTIQPYVDVINGGQPAPGYSATVLDGLKNAKNKHSPADNGKMALARLTRDVEDIIKVARENKFWKIVLGACECYEVLEPGNVRTQRYIDEANLQLARPKVKIKGFFDDKETKDIYVFVDAEIRGVDEIKQFRIREGEEFLDPPHTLRFVEILGNNKGIRLEYLAIEGDTFDVMKND